MSTPVERAAAAIVELEREGARVTTEAVRARAGVGMAAALEATRERRVRAMGFTAAAAEQTSSDVPPALLEAAKVMWAAARAEASAELVRDRESWAALLREREQEIEVLRAELAETATICDGQQRMIDQLKEDKPAPVRRARVKVADDA